MFRAGSYRLGVPRGRLYCQQLLFFAKLKITKQTSVIDKRPVTKGSSYVRLAYNSATEFKASKESLSKSR